MKLTYQTKIRALGRYNSVRNFAKNNNCKVISLKKSLIDQTGVYNVRAVIEKLKSAYKFADEIKILNGNESCNCHWCWYKGWLAVEK